MRDTKSVWLNGKLASWDVATVCVTSPSLSCGMVVVEDVPCYAGASGSFVFRTADHVTQFVRSAKIADMPIPYTADKLTKAVAKVAAAGELARGVVRMMAFYASASEDDAVSVSLYCVPYSSACSTECGCEEPSLDAGNSDGGMDGSSADSSDGGASNATAVCDSPSSKSDASKGGPLGVSACVSSWRAVSNNALPPQALLAAHRANAELALRDARRCGFDQPILLNEAGDVCSGAGRAIFAVRDGVLSTPPLACGVRESVERDTIINFAMDLDVPIVEERMTRADLYSADEVFFCDVGGGVLPVRCVDGREVGKDGKLGAITKALAGRFAKMVDGKLDEYRAWATEIAQPACGEGDK